MPITLSDLQRPTAEDPTPDIGTALSRLVLPRVDVDQLSAPFHTQIAALVEATHQRNRELVAKISAAGLGGMKWDEHLATIQRASGGVLFTPRVGTPASADVEVVEQPNGIAVVQRRGQYEKTRRLQAALQELCAAYPDITPGQIVRYWYQGRYRVLREAYGNQAPSRTTLWRHWPKELSVSVSREPPKLKQGYRYA